MGFLGKLSSHNMLISIISPIYNEEQNILPMLEEIYSVMKKNQLRFELICVDDGSKDNSLEILKSQAKKRPYLKVIHFWRNYGQTAAMSAGVDHAKGDVIITIDGDLQNDPENIPNLLKKLEEGYDVVSGWRKDRKDNSFSRTLPSRIANKLISIISTVHLNDYGCTLKAYKREVISGVRLYGEMHRFIPIYAQWQGAKVTELVVNHRPRIHGVSKYGISRTFRVILDLIFIGFMHKYSQKPMHFFGGVGLLGVCTSILTFVWAIERKFYGEAFIKSPLLLISTTLFLFGGMAILMGIIAEMVMRVYYETQNKTTYRIRDTFNL